LSDPVLVKSLGFCRPRGAEAMQPVADQIAGMLKADFLADFAKGFFKEGIHKDFAVDADRGIIRSFNKELLPHGDGESVIQGLKSLIKNEKLRALMCFASFQAGITRLISGYATNSVAPDKKEPWLDMELPSLQEQLSRSLLPFMEHQSVDLTVTGGKAVLRFDGLAQLKDTRRAGAPAAEARYTAEMTVDLGQDPGAEGFPAFDLKLSCSPAQCSGVLDPGEPAWPEGMQGTGLARDAERALGGDAKPLLALVRREAARHADIIHTKPDSRATAQSDLRRAAALRLEVARQAPVAAAELAQALKGAFAPFRERLAALAAGAPDARAAADAARAGYAALIESIGAGLPEALREHRAEVLQALGDDPAWNDLSEAVEAVASLVR
ncbi:MAG: hypothetical protein HUK26_09235, partial [Duodenibacillus sp.]|nr:hypothetical protein [Duodenibacillus sp.]